MSKRKVKNKIYALIIAVTLFVSVNNLSQAEEKSTVAGMMLADNAGRISTKEELDNEGISDIKSRYSAEEVEIGSEPGSKRVKRSRRNAARQAAKGKGKTNNVFEADRETNWKGVYRRRTAEARGNLQETTFQSDGRHHENRC